jgi:hypothetical protein
LTLLIGKINDRWSKMVRVSRIVTCIRDFSKLY